MSEWLIAFININTFLDSWCWTVSINASTFEITLSVTASSTTTYILCFDTFVDILTSLAVTSVSIIADTITRQTNSVRVTILEVLFTTLSTRFVVVRQYGWWNTITFEAANGVLALRIRWTVILVSFAFVNIQTESTPFTSIAFITRAAEGAFLVEAFSESMAIILPCHTLVNINTFTTVSLVSKFACTCEGSFGIETSSFLVTVVDTFLTFVDVGACVTVTRESCLTFTFKWTLCVYTFCVLVACHIGE